MTPFAVQRMSGWTFQWFMANHSPVRPQPLMTSSAIMSTPLSSQIFLRRGRYSSGGTRIPFVPTTGSMMIAATFPSFLIMYST